jgi:ubiquitin C-terminal hydrolase
MSLSGLMACTSNHSSLDSPEKSQPQLGIFVKDEKFANLEMGSLLKGETSVKTFLIKNQGTSTITQVKSGELSAPFKITGTHEPWLGGECGSEMKPDSTCKLSIEFAPASKNDLSLGEINSHLKLSFVDSAGNSQEQELKLLGYLLSPGVVRLKDSASESVHIKNIPTDTSFKKKIEITNMGEVPITIEKTEWSGSPEFTFKGGSFPGSGGTCESTLKPKKSCMIVLGFSTEHVGEFNSSLAFHYQDGIRSHKSVIRIVANSIQRIYTPEEILAKKEAYQSSVLGLKQLNNTCFANAAHKLLSVHPQVINLFTLPNTGINVSALPLKARLKESFRRFFASLSDRLERFENDVQNIPSNSFHETELRSIFDTFQAFLNHRSERAQTRGLVYNNPLGGVIRTDQIDSLDYLNTIFDLYKYCTVFNCLREVPFTKSTINPAHIRMSDYASQTPLQSLALDLLQEDGNQIPNLGASLAQHLAPRAQDRLDFNGVQEAGEISTVVKHDVVRGLPGQLLISLKRFIHVSVAGVYQQQKLTHRFEIPEVIEIPTYPSTLTAAQYDSQSVNPTLLRMHLTAAIIHTGTPTNGHYIAYTYSERKRGWYQHNDAKVKLFDAPGNYATVANLPEVGLNANAYVLLYTVSPNR